MWRTAIVSPRFGVVDHDRALHHRAGAEDRDLRLVDDRGVEQSAPTLPRLVIVNVPPESSSGPILLVRVRSATSAIFLASPAIDRSPASLMTGVSRPFSVSTANARFSRSK